VTDFPSNAGRCCGRAHCSQSPDVVLRRFRDRLAIPGETITAMMVMDYNISRDAFGDLALADSGRAVLKAMMGDL
jgi:hypothetical protein